MKDFGKGPVLKEAAPELRDDKRRIERILTVAETDSVSEGLPPFDAVMRDRLRRRLRGRDEPCPTPGE
jgi:hypothetical protein